MADLRTRVRSALIWRSGMQIAAQSVQWILTLVVIRLLAPRDYGLVAMAEVVTAFLTILAGYSVTSAIIQTPELGQRQIRQFFGMLLLVNVALAALQFAGAPLVASYYREPIIADLLRVQAVNYLMIPFIALPTGLASRAMEFRSPAITQFLAMIASGLCVVTLAWLGYGVWSLVIGTIVMHAARAIGLAIAIRWLLWPLFRFDGIGHLLSFGGVVLVNSVLWFFYSQADIFIGGRALSAHDVGIYATGLFLASLPVSKVLPALNEVGFSAYARIQGDMAAVHENFLRSTRMIALLLFPMFAGLALVAPQFVPVVLGAQWAGAVPVVQTLALAMPFYAIYVLQSPLTNAIGMPRVGLYNSVIGLCLMPAAFLVGVRWGANGLAYAWLFMFPPMFLLVTANTLRAIRMPAGALAKAVAPAIVASLVMAAAVFAVQRSLPLDPLAVLLLSIAVGTASYTGAAFVLFPAALRDLAGFVGLRLPGHAR